MGKFVYIYIYLYIGTNIPIENNMGGQNEAADTYTLHESEDTTTTAESLGSMEDDTPPYTQEEIMNTKEELKASKNKDDSNIFLLESKALVGKRNRK